MSSTAVEVAPRVRAVGRSTERTYAPIQREIARVAALEHVGWPWPPEAVGAYAWHLASRGIAWPTVRQRVYVLDREHMLRGFDPPGRTPLVRGELETIRRRIGRPARRVAPLLVEILSEACARIRAGDPRGPQDRAILCVLFAGCLRAAELCAIEVAHLAPAPPGAPAGLELTIPRSKTDPYGEGVQLGLPLAAAPAICPVRSISVWLELAPVGAAGGYVFRPLSRSGRVIGPGPLSTTTIARIVRARLRDIPGIDPAQFAGHSGRRGFLTSGWRAGFSELELASQSRHRDLRQLRAYLERDPWRRNPAVRLLAGSTGELRPVFTSGPATGREV